MSEVKIINTDNGNALIENLDLLGPICEKCKLCTGCETPFMQSWGSETPEILFVGEAPGAEEDRLGRPFVGKSGKLLQDAIAILELDPEQYRFTNSVRCRPRKNKTPTARQIKYCSEFLLKEIEQFNPKVVVLLGNTPLRSVLNRQGIMTWNGIPVQRKDEGITYVPAYHPAYVLRNNGAGSVLEDWISALTVAVEAAGGAEYKRADDRYEYIFPEYISELENMAEALFAEKEYVTYDVETVWLDETRPGNMVLTIAFATRDKAWSYPIDHKEAWWNHEPEFDELYSEYDDVIDITCEILETHPRLIGHNVRFDNKIVRRFLKADHIPWGNTMNISQLIESKKGVHGLKKLAGQHLGMFDYDKELDDYCREHSEADYERGGNYGEVPLEILLPYGGMDVAATWLLYPILYGKLNEKQQALYHQLLTPVDYVLGQMESYGFPLDKSLARRYYAIYQYAKERYYSELIADEEVGLFVSRKQAELDENKGGRKGKTFEFNPNSTQQVAEILYGLDYKGHPVPERTEKGNPSVKMGIIKNFGPVRDDPFFEPYRLWKLMASMQSKYLGPAALNNWDWGDSRVRTSFNIGGTKTGRLSSSNPNLQNIPTPEKEPGTLLALLRIKNIFTHTHEGGCLLAADYAGMELRVIAAISQCKGMIHTFMTGGDIHSYVTKMVFRDELPLEAQDMPDYIFKDVYKDVRYKAKWTNWTFLYGGDAHTLHGMYGLPTDYAKYVQDRYYGEFPEILEYQQGTIKFAEKHGYVESPFGRRLTLPYINERRDIGRRNQDRRTGVNMPIQSTASDIMLCALIVIYDKMKKMGLKSRLVNTVHDSLVIDVHPGELETLTELVVHSMENVPNPVIADEYFPGIDFSWLTMPLEADLELGSHYGSYGIPKWEDTSRGDYNVSYHAYVRSIEERLASRLRPVFSSEEGIERIPRVV